MKKFLLEDAILLAVEAHRGQEDLNGEPYIFHPLRVMLSVPTEYRMAAVLHDVVEDTLLDLSGLAERGVPMGDVEVVGVLTRREGEKYFDYIRRCVKNPAARIIKAADIQDNLLPERNCPPGLLERYEKALKTLGGKS